MPVDNQDPVPAFVKEQAEWFKKIQPEMDIAVLAPHSSYSNTKDSVDRGAFHEYRFHYFWPRRWELLTGRGIMPALKTNKILYLQIPFLFIGEFIATYRYVRQFKPTLIYAHWFVPQAAVAYLVSKITKVPFVFTTHASDIIALKKVPMIERLLWRVCSQAKGYTAVSPTTANKMLRVAKHNDELVKQKLQIIPMGTTPGKKPSKSYIAKINKLHNPNNKKIIFFMGRLASIKGIDYLIRAYAEIGEEKKNTKLIIAGDGLERNNLENIAKECSLKSENIEFVGHISGIEKSAFLTIADVLCIPSIQEGEHSEGLPVVLMEGLQAGNIIVASNVSGAQGLIKDGLNGFIFEQRNIDELKNKLIAAVSMNLKKKSILLKESTALGNNFQWQKVIQDHYNYFEKRLNAEL